MAEEGTTVQDTYERLRELIGIRESAVAQHVLGMLLGLTSAAYARGYDDGMTAREDRDNEAHARADAAEADRGRWD